LGVDALALGPLRFGALGSFALARYSRVNAKCEYPILCNEYRIEHRTYHEWFGFGIRAVVLIPVGSGLD
jgi:hypothetical protein